MRDLERQFLRLRQGSMTVEEYEVEFDRLSKFAVKLVEDDGFKARRFAQGLNPDMRIALAGFLEMSYAEVVRRAKYIDAVKRTCKLKRQLLRLRQGSMTVEEYEVEFDRLSKFAVNLVEDDGFKAQIFAQGLNPDIRIALAGFLEMSYAEVVRRAKYIDAVKRTWKLKRQFLRLRQGSMTVEEYEVEFDRLSKFAVNIVEDDGFKAQRFAQGLNPDIRIALAGFLEMSYAEVVRRAKYIDAVCRDTEEEEEEEEMQGFQRKRDRSIGLQHNHFTGRRTRPRVDIRGPIISQNVSRPPRHQPQGSSASAFHPGQSRCLVCGGAHLSPECRRATGACFKCGSLEHRIAECPQQL